MVHAEASTYPARGLGPAGEHIENALFWGGCVFGSLDPCWIPCRWDTGVPVRHLVSNRYATLFALGQRVSPMPRTSGFFPFRVQELSGNDHSVFAAAVLVNLYVDDVLRIMRRIETGCSV